MKRIAIQIILISFLAIQSIPANAQNFSISGVITDADSGDPLPFVNVFLANTTIGDASDSAGLYVLERVPSASYELVISRIGYELHVIPVRVVDQDLVINASLAVKPIEGAEVQVEAEAPDEWIDLLNEFRTNFIGTSSRAKNTHIMNPQVLQFSRDPETNALIAKTDSMLYIRNKELGYDIDVLLEHFHWYGDTGSYIIYPQFAEINFDNPRQKRRTIKRREALFERSLRQFLAYLARFEIHRMYSVKIYTTKPQPGYKELDKNELLLILKKSPFDSAVRRLEVSKSIRVDYEMINAPSILSLKYGYLDINEYGNYLPMDGLILSGYWATFRLADSLPSNYWPAE